MLRKDRLFKRLSAVLAGDDTDTVYFALRIADLTARDFCALGLRFSTIYDFPIEGIAEIFRDGPQLRTALLWACRSICESEKYGNYLLAIAVFLTTVCTPRTPPEILFPVLYGLVKDYSMIVRETVPLMGFLHTKLPAFLCGRSAGWALRLCLAAMDAFPGMTAEVSIEDLVDLLRVKSERVRGLVLELLAVRCAEPNSDWIFALLFDAGIDGVLCNWLVEGSFRLKRAVLSFARLVLEHAVEMNQKAAMLNRLFLFPCVDFLSHDDPGMRHSILKFLELIPRKVVEADVVEVVALVTETELIDKLEEIALSGGETALLAHGLLVELRQLLEI
jgi:hypothetical protein